MSIDLRVLQVHVVLVVLKVIAAVFKVTESRVCQLHSQSIARLRTRLRES